MAREIDATKWIGQYPVTTRVRHVLTVSREYAHRRHHEYIGTEHLLAGLVMEEDGVAAGVLQRLGIDADAVVSALDAQVPMGTSTPASPDATLPYTSRAKKVLELADFEARLMHHGYLGTEHVLLGILAEEKGIGAQLLAQFGVQIDAVRAETLRILGPDAASVSTPPRRVSAFIQVSLDGYFTDPNGDMRFAHKPPDDKEWNEFVAGNASGASVLLFGHTTYDMMASWWPTPAAAQAMPEVAAQMNATQKVVFSRTMTSAAWSNTTVAADLLGTVRRMKGEPGPDMVILGSGSLIMQLADARLLDSLQVVLNPIALGAGKSLFAGLTEPFSPTLTRTRVFKNGSVVLWYD